MRSRTSLSQLGKLFEFPRAVAEFLGPNAQLVEQSQLEVRQRRVFGIDDVTATLKRPRASAEQQGWQGPVGVAVAVANARTIDERQVIEQRAVSIRCLSQFLQKPSE